MTARPVPLGGRRASVVWLTAVSVYFLAVFHRSSLGVAGLAASERFDISASQLSTFTVLQLLVYAGMQIPVGVLLDRFGPQRLLFAGAILMTAAQLGFAFTGSFAGAVVARVFVGMGDAMVFISVLRIIASWFPPMPQPGAHRVDGAARPVSARSSRRSRSPGRWSPSAGPGRSRSPPRSGSCSACWSS